MIETYLAKTAHFFPWLTHSFNFKSGVPRQVPAIPDIMHDTKKWWDFQHFLLNPFLFFSNSQVTHSPTFEKLRQAPASLPPHTFSSCAVFWSCLHRLEGDITVPYYPPLTNFWAANNPTSESGCGIVDFFTVIPWADVSSPSSLSTFMRLKRPCQLSDYFERGMWGHFFWTLHPCAHSTGSVLYAPEIFGIEQVWPAQSSY